MPDLERETARMIGSANLGKQIRTQVQSGICALEARAGCKITDDQVTLPE